MKQYSISIKEEDKDGKEGILTKVYRLTANAAVQRGDAQAVATEDNKDMLQQFKDEGFKLLERAFGRYYVGNGGYSMPSNWPNMSEEINEQVETGLVNYILAKWYELNGTGDKYMAVFSEVLTNIAKILNKREKPI
jgi:hypothetical protein